MSTKFVKSIFAALAISTIVVSIQNSSLNKLDNNSISEAKSTRLIQLKTLEKMPSIGFRNIVSDWSFLSFLQYFGNEENRNKEGYALSPTYLSVVVEQDPYYRPFYLFLSESTTFYAGMPDKTVSLMKKGLAHFRDHKPADSYYIWRYKGTDELLFLDKAQSAQRSFEMAAKWAEASDEKDSKLMAALSKQTASFIASDPDSTSAKISAWGSVLTTSRDENTRKIAVSKIRGLGGNVFIDDGGGIKIEYSPKSTQKN